MNVIQADGNWKIDAPPPRAVEIPSDVRAKFESWLTTGKLQLPIMPEASALLLSMTSDEECSIQELSDVVQRDPLLAAHMLRIANSALYAPKYPANSLRLAITRLGVLELRRVVVTIACQTRVFQIRGWETEVGELLLHSLSTALYATEIAKMVRASEEEAFLSGLLHDVGHAVVLQGLVDLEKSKTLVLERPLMVQLAEENHTLVGSRLVEQWGLSPRLAEAIARHHEVVRKPATNLAIVHLADRLAYGHGEAPTTLEENAPATLEEDPVIAGLALSAAQLQDLADKRRSMLGLAAALM